MHRHQGGVLRDRFILQNTCARPDGRSTDRHSTTMRSLININNNKKKHNKNNNIIIMSGRIVVNDAANIAFVITPEALIVPDTARVLFPVFDF